MQAGVGSGDRAGSAVVAALEVSDSTDERRMYRGVAMDVNGKTTAAMVMAKAEFEDFMVSKD